MEFIGRWIWKVTILPGSILPGSPSKRFYDRHFYPRSGSQGSEYGGVPRWKFYPPCAENCVVVPKSSPGSFRWILNASYNRQGPSINDQIYDYTTTLIGFKESLYPCLRTRFMSRIDLRKAFKQFFRAISQMHLLATKINDFVFIDATMSMGLRNTCKLCEEDFMRAFVKGFIHHQPDLFIDSLGPLIDSYLHDI